MRYLNKEFVGWLKKKGTKKAERCLNALDRDIMLIVEYKGIITIESVSTAFEIPNYLYDEAKRFVKEVVI